METIGLNNPKLHGDNQDPDGPPIPATVDTSKTSEDLKPTTKGVENAKKRLRAFSIQKKSSLSPIPPPKPICTTVGAVGTVFIGKLASSKPALKSGGIEEVHDSKKPPKPPKPGTSKLQNVSSPLADYLNTQKKTLSEIEDMKRKMELVDLGIPLGLICPAPNSDKAMPTKAMPPIKSMMLDPAKVDEIIRDAKKARAEGKSFKFSYEKLLPGYQNPFAKKDKDKDRDREAPLIEEPRLSRDKRRPRRYSSHKDDKRGRDWHPKANKVLSRARTIRERQERGYNIKSRAAKSKRDVKSKESDKKSKSEKVTKTKENDSKLKEKIDTINLSDEDDEVQEIIDSAQEVSEKNIKETDVNLKDFVVCDSWSENEDKPKDKHKDDKKDQRKETKTSPVQKYIDPMEQLKQSLIKDAKPPVEIKVEKLQPVTDSLKFEIEDENDDEALDIFAENTCLEKFAKHIPLPKEKGLYDSPLPIRFDYESKDPSIDAMDESFLESVIAEIKQEEMDDGQDKGLVEYDSPKDDGRESVTPELDDKTRKIYTNRSEYSDGLKSVESVKSTESGFKSTESGYKSTESGNKSTESGYKSTESRYKSTETRKKSTSSRSKSIESNISVDSHKSTDSRSKSTESDRKSSDSGRNATERLRSTGRPRTEETMAKSTVDSLETWSFVLKICQPLLFRHDKSKCYKETRGNPKLWYTENPKLCDCVKDRSVVYEELEMCKMEIVDNIYEGNLVQDAVYPEARGWYPANFLAESGAVPRSSEWEAEDSQEPPTPPHSRDEMVLDREYQKFMEAVWPEVEAPKSETPRCTPVRDVKKRAGNDTDVGKKKKMKMEGKISSEGWSQESEVDEELVKNKKRKGNKIKLKRKHSPSDSDSEDVSPTKKKKTQNKEKSDKSKYKTKRQRLSKKYLKKLKGKQERQLKKKRKHAKMEQESEIEENEKEKKKRDKKLKKKKLLKQKKKNQKKKSKKSSSSSSGSESERKSKKKEKRKKKKRKQSTSESNQSDELFDVNILNNIKTERLTDDEKAKHFSTNKKHREIINVKQLQNDFVSIQIKKEIEDVNSPEEFEESFTEEEKKEKEEKEIEKEADNIEVKISEEKVEVKIDEKEVLAFEKDEHEFKEPENRSITPQLKPVLEENLSQCSSQESSTSASAKEYEKDESHLRPSSHNSNYSFHDVMRSEGHDLTQTELYHKGIGMEMEADYEQGNYEMYEQMAMEYQSDVASQRVPPPDEQTSGRIETVVRTRNRGEIKCDWRAGDPSDPSTPTTPQRPSRWGDPGEGHPEASVNTTPQRPSRWGLKPSEVNIVLTGGSGSGSEGEPSDTYPIETVVASAPAPAPASAPAPSPVYRIQSLANRTDNNSNSGYDEAYMDMYGAADRLQYGDCFSRETAVKELEQRPLPLPLPLPLPVPLPLHSSSLDDRIDLALRTTILGDVAKDDTQDNDGPDKGILITKSLCEQRSVKRVSFADGYKPGQDSDTEQPPVTKRKKVRRMGCPWPCPATHPDHVSLWDALPPPPPPPGSPPPPATRAPPTHLLRTLRPSHSMLPQPPHPMAKFDPSSLAGFMPPEPPPGLISF